MITEKHETVAVIVKIDSEMATLTEEIEQLKSLLLNLQTKENENKAEFEQLRLANAEIKRL